jgi:hypothetical protein
MHLLNQASAGGRLQTEAAAGGRLSQKVFVLVVTEL